MDNPDDLDTQARKADPDRWLASRFIADEVQRADVIAIYALDYELARVPVVVKEPMMAEIRLTWWREALEKIFAGQTPAGPSVLEALVSAVARHGLSAEPFEAMVEARFAEIHTEPFADLEALQAYADGAHGAPMALALAVLGHGDAAALRPAALAWTLAQLSREVPPRTPPDWDADQTRRRGLAALKQAAGAIGALPVTAFPAVAHLTLAKAYLKGRAPGAFETRLRLTTASMLGRI